MLDNLFYYIDAIVTVLLVVLVALCVILTGSVVYLTYTEIMGGY